MTYKQIEAAREVRLWIGQIIVPACAVVVSMLTIPEVRKAVAEKAKDVERTIKYRRKKNERA